MQAWVINPVFKGSGKICAVFGCSNSDRVRSIWKHGNCSKHLGKRHDECPCLHPFSLHGFPRDEDLKRKWISALNRKGFTPKKHSKVCSIHFLDGSPTSQNPVPQLHLGYDRKIAKGRRPLTRIGVPQENDERPPKRQKVDEEMETVPLETNTSVTEEYQVENVPPETNTSVIKEHEVENQQSATNTESFPTKATNVYKLKRCVITDSKSCQATVMTHNQGTQWELFAESDHNYCKPQTHGFKVFSDKGCQANFPLLTPNDLTSNDSLFYTGLRLNIFFLLLKMLTPHVKEFKFQMGVGDQLLLVLMRLRLGLLYYDLGRRFECSRSLASKIFNAWVPVLAMKLQSLICWLPRETIRATLPLKFRELYPRTTCIIDCSEVFIQRPSLLRTRAATYSNYKHHNTLKFLIAVAPSGYVMFLSKCYGGRASDLHIVSDCGLYNYILPGDEVMADRGFTIEESLWLRQAKLNIPAFTRGKSQLSESEVTQTRRIACIRVHVERAIRRVKQYRILSAILPLDNLKNTANNIIMICAALTNLQPLLIKDKEIEDLA